MDFWVSGGIANVAPRLTVWFTALVLSSILLKRSDGRAERFLVVGSALMLVSTLVSASGDAVANYAIRNGYSAGEALRYITWSAGLISLPGIMCLFYAVWKKFSERNSAVATRK